MNVIENAFNHGADYFLKYPFSIAELEKIYQTLKQLNDYTNIEYIASQYSYDWAIEV